MDCCFNCFASELIAFSLFDCHVDCFRGIASNASKRPRRVTASSLAFDAAVNALSRSVYARSRSKRSSLNRSSVLLARACASIKLFLSIGIVTILGEVCHEELKCERRCGHSCRVMIDIVLC